MGSEYRGHNSLRCKTHDYALSGAYVITICTQDKKCFFGHIKEGKMVLNEKGRIVEKEWKITEKRREDVRLGEWVVMPNHFHGILFLTNFLDERNNQSVVRASQRDAPTNRVLQPKTVSSIMCQFKGACTKKIKLLDPTFAWQRSFYDHIIRDEKDLESCWEYILNNPMAWELDKLNPDFDYNKVQRDHKMN